MRRGAGLLAGYRLEDVERVAGWSVRERDRALFELRAELFGDEAVALAACPECDEPLEVPLDLAALRPRAGESAPPPFEHDGWTALLRSPTTDDLTVLLEATGEDAALAVLVDRCVASLHRPDGTPTTPERAPAEVRELLRMHLAEAVDDLDIELRLTCAACGHHFTAPFDIAPFLLREIEAWAARMHREVHVIAGAYGWDEPTILGLSPRRRQTYLHLIGGAG